MTPKNGVPMRCPRVLGRFRRIRAEGVPRRAPRVPKACPGCALLLPRPVCPGAPPLRGGLGHRAQDTELRAAYLVAGWIAEGSGNMILSESRSRNAGPAWRPS
jgi:hypothetical protein